MSDNQLLIDAYDENYAHLTYKPNNTLGGLNLVYISKPDPINQQYAARDIFADSNHTMPNTEHGLPSMYAACLALLCCCCKETAERQFFNHEYQQVSQQDKINPALFEMQQERELRF